MQKILTPVFALMGLFAEFSQGAVLITFEEEGGNVVASTSGTFIIPTTYNGTFGINSSSSASFQGLLWVRQGTERYCGGTFVNSGLVLANSVMGGFSTFGYIQEHFYAPSSEAQGSVYSPVTTWTFDSTDIDSLFPSGLSTTPFVVYTASNGETISFVSAVPEPSSALLFVFGAAGACVWRRRK